MQIVGGTQAIYVCRHPKPFASDLYKCIKEFKSSLSTSSVNYVIMHIK